MALDTANNRASAIHVGLPWRGLFPRPDGTLDQADRQQGAGFYSGILAAGAPIVVSPAVALVGLPPPLAPPPLLLVQLEPTQGIAPLGATTLRWAEERVPPWRLRPSGRVVQGRLTFTSGPSTIGARARVTEHPRAVVGHLRQTMRGTALRSTGTVRRVVRGTARLGHPHATHDEVAALELLGWSHSRPFEESPLYD